MIVSATGVPYCRIIRYTENICFNNSITEAQVGFLSKFVSKHFSSFEMRAELVRIRCDCDYISIPCSLSKSLQCDNFP